MIWSKNRAFKKAEVVIIIMKPGQGCSVDLCEKHYGQNQAARALHLHFSCVSVLTCHLAVIVRVNNQGIGWDG